VTDKWVAPDDGGVASWSFKGKVYYRNAENDIWLKAADGGLGAWQGVYMPADNSIDDSVPEPNYEDEE
jgi:hypothetical protein